MELQRITRSWLRNNGACYSNKQIAELVPKGGVTPQQVLETDRIPDEDKIWVVTRENLLPKTIMATWLAGIVERALGGTENTDPRYVAVISMLRRIVSGEEVGQEERDRIRNDAWDAASAAWYASHRAAWYAASAADCAALRAADAAYHATYAAHHASSVADYAACRAAWDAAQDETAERKQQVQDLLALLKD